MGVDDLQLYRRPGRWKVGGLLRPEAKRDRSSHSIWCEWPAEWRDKRHAEHRHANRDGMATSYSSG